MSKRKLTFNPATAELELQTFVETAQVEGRVATFAELPTASSNTGSIYIVEQDTGSIFLLNKREAGLYRSNGTTWTPFSDISALSIETDNTNIGAPEANVQSALEFILGLTGASGSSWRQLVTEWDTPPTVNKAIASGTVYNYTFNSVTRFRLVPSSYVASSDTFYETFNSGTDTLSNPIVSRGF